MYENLVEFIGKDDGPRTFYPVMAPKILLAEQRLGFLFPQELRVFFLEIGYGFWQQGFKDSKPTYNTNRIMDPLSIADLYLDEGNELRPPEGFRNGDLPFFEIMAFSFLFITITPGYPNVVVDCNGTRVASGVRDFMKRLYHEAKFWLKDIDYK